jgi:hypothetical protein
VLNFDKANPADLKINVTPGSFNVNAALLGNNEYTSSANDPNRGIAYTSSQTDFTFVGKWLSTLATGSYTFYIKANDNIIYPIEPSAGVEVQKITINVIDSTTAPTIAQAAKPKAIAPGKTLQLTAPTNTLTTTYKSSNPKVATVDPATGLVKGIKEGTAKITITANNGKAASKVVTVTIAKAVTKITAKSKVTVKVKKTATVKIKTKVAKAAIKSVKSSKKAVATVAKSGYNVKIKGKKAGKATVTVTYWNGKSKKIKVTVK